MVLSVSTCNVLNWTDPKRHLWSGNLEAKAIRGYGEELQYAGWYSDMRFT